VTFTEPVAGASGAYAPDLPSIQAWITDGSDGAIDAGSIAMWVNGTEVSPASPKSSGVTKVTYTPPARLASGSVNAVSIAFTDASSHRQTNTWNFTVANYTVLPASLALPAGAVNTSKRGFLLHTVLNGAHTAQQPEPGDGITTNDWALPTSVYRAELQVHQLLGWPNTAQTSAFSGPAGSYVEPNVVNYNGRANNAGNFTDNGGAGLTMPGIPSLTSLGSQGDANDGSDNYTVEFLTVIPLQAGYYTMGVSSDDGFAVTVGNPNECWTLPLVLGAVDAGNSGTDSKFNFYVTQAGLYPFRLLYFQGGGDNEVEWFLMGSYPTNSMHLLLNGNTTYDTTLAPVGTPTYQYPVLTTKGSPYVSAYGPVRMDSPFGAATLGDGGYHVGTDAPITAVLTDGETAVTGTITLLLNGVPVSPTVNKVGGNTTVYYKPATPFTPGSTNRVSLTFLDRAVGWQFVVGSAPTPAFYIEAEDFNYGGGATLPAASSMPYAGGAYVGLGALVGTDYYQLDLLSSPLYRVGELNNVPCAPNPDRDRGLTEINANFMISPATSGQWYNYTRTFPAGSYCVYGGLSSAAGAGTAHARYALLQSVDNPASATPIVTTLGVFDASGSGAAGLNYPLVPLTDFSGQLVALNLSGVQTLRYALPVAGTITYQGGSQTVLNGSGDFDYLLLSTVPTRPTLSIGYVNGQVIVTFTGTLQSCGTVNGNYQDLTGVPNPYPVPNGSAPIFFRARR